MKTTILKTVLFLFALTLFNCEGNNLNTNESTGNDSFSCLVNGKLYTPSAGTGIGGGDIRPFSWAFKENGNNKRITFYGGGEYTLFMNLLNPVTEKNTLNEELSSELDTSHSGMVLHNERIFYNTKSNQENGNIIFTELSSTIAVGTFECTLYNDKGDELKVTEGKFNLSLDSKRN
ncbi:hypothetical protein H9W90_01975 [Polaribacter pectinis]|uniref:Lipocalin-like domain-containing protein n=1 Tax=Polaribacter pectinis TaxID=2738844 RepID=A0A7G9LBB3_9FLAO|nr:hypothetical protein [Polaribacter pectinis]QNM85912.1 hypothetical protein H9W90_01975 [Polaribacter pectinis]